MSDFYKSNWKKEWFHLSEKDSFPEEPGHNRLKGKFSRTVKFTEQNVLKIYKQLLELRLQNVNQALRKFD